jgi:hypothetical protein
MIPQIIPNYSFWRHPIRWMRERKMRRFMQVLLLEKWPKMEPELQRMYTEAMLYGTAYRMQKDVKPYDL